MEAKPESFRLKGALGVPCTYLEFTLPPGRVQGVYKGCSPGVHGILAGTPDGHPLYTPCTRPDSSGFSGYLDNDYGCLERAR